MIPATLDGLEHYVWPYEPEWGQGVTARFSIETDTVSSLTKRENRRAYSQTLRVELDATYILDGATAATVRNALRILQDTPVRLPFLPAIDDVAGFNSRWYLAADDGPANLYWTNNPADISGRQHITPTLLGFLAEAPKFSLETTDAFAVGLRWRESSNHTERLEPGYYDWDTGPAIGARDVYQFPFLPDFQQQQDAGQVIVDVDRQQLGFNRVWQSAAYPQIGSRNPVFGYTLQSGEAAKLLRFFMERSGTVDPFWLPCWVQECSLAADAHAADTTITVTNAAALGDHRYIQLFGVNGPVMRHITGIAGNVLTLDSALGIDFALDTVLSTLALVRFASAQLTVNWQAPDLATAQIAFTEVTQEYLTPLGEDYAQTIGPLSPKSYAFELRHGAEVWRWTSFEGDFTYPPVFGDNYISTAIEFSDITDGLAWETNSCKLKMRSTPGHPLVRLLTRTATERFELVVSEIGDRLTVIFRGWVTKAAFDGPWIEADATSFGSLFSRKVPRTLMQPTDNYALFDAGNRLAKADWTFTGRLAAVVGNVFTLDTLAWPQGALPAIPDNYFALGYIERPNPVERIPIVGSAAIVAGVVTVTLAHALMNGAAVTPEAGWKLIPGYDGLSTTATVKFNNLRNFAGFPEVPLVDPSMIPVVSNGSNPGKK